MKACFIVVVVLLVSGTKSKPTTSAGDMENDVKVPDQEHGPQAPDEELHGVLMHGDQKPGADHHHEHEELKKKIPNQKHGPHSPIHHERGAKHVEHESNEEFGPKDPMKDLHGVLMHGDTEKGHHHEMHFEEGPKGTAKVSYNEKVDDGVTIEVEEKEIHEGDIGTIDGEELIHGKQGVHTHSHDSHETDESVPKKPGPFNMDEDILHQIMHDGKIDEHTDEKLLAAKKIGIKDLLDLQLDDELLSQIDIKKLLQNNRQEYNSYQKDHKGVKDPHAVEEVKIDKNGQHEHWSLWDQVSKIRLKFAGGDDDVTEDKDPYKAEWEDVLIRRPVDEDDIAFKMDIGANSGPINARKKKLLHDEQ